MRFRVGSPRGRYVTWAATATPMGTSVRGDDDGVRSGRMALTPGVVLPVDAERLDRRRPGRGQPAAVGPGELGEEPRP
jgi:hypothetical protein